MRLSPEQLIIHARVYLSRFESLPINLAVDLTKALEEQLAESKQLREKLRQLEQGRAG